MPSVGSSVPVDRSRLLEDRQHVQIPGLRLLKEADDHFAIEHLYRFASGIANEAGGSPLIIHAVDDEIVEGFARCAGRHSLRRCTTAFRFGEVAPERLQGVELVQGRSPLSWCGRLTKRD